MVLIPINKDYYYYAFEFKSIFFLQVRHNELFRETIYLTLGFNSRGSDPKHKEKLSMITVKDALSDFSIKNFSSIDKINFLILFIRFVSIQ